jgi:hypothetical protein
MEHQPITARGVFYRAVSAGLIPKDEGAVRLVQGRLLKLRREGVIPYPWIVDDSREVYGRNSFGGLAELADEVAGFYRRDYWRRSDTWVQIWLEKRTLKGVIAPNDLRRLIDRAISQHMPNNELDALKSIEAEERFLATSALQRLDAEGGW